MSLKTLLEDWCESPPDLIVEGLSLDSRGVQTGDAFIAVAGGLTHGMAFAGEAESKGARVIIHDGLAPLPALGW